MSLKFAAVGNLMALSAFENHALVQDRFKTLSPRYLRPASRNDRPRPQGRTSGAQVRRETRQPGSLVKDARRRLAGKIHREEIQKRIPR